MASAYLHRTNGTPTNSQKMTFSTWFKIGTQASQQSLFGTLTGGGPYTQVKIMALATHNNVFRFEAESVEGNAIDLKTNRALRDCGAWYHLVIGIDTTQSVAADRTKIYINGVQETSFATSTYPTLNDTLDYSKSGTVAQIMAYNNTEHWNGVFAHTHFIDGLQYAASDFGETDSTSGIWVAKTGPSVTYGDNGFFLKYVSGAITTDSSGEGNTMTQVGTITTTKDTPDNNFCTWNPNNKSHNQTYTFENGNTVALIPSASGWAGTSGTLAAGAGKWYMEGKVNYTPGALNTTCGFASNRAIACKTAYGQLGYVDKGSVDDYAPSFGVYDNGALLYATTSAVSQSTGSWATAWVSGDIVMFAIDIDNGKFYFGANGTWDAGASNDPAAGTGGYTFTPDGFLYTPITTIYQGRLEMNFGNGYFSTTAIGSPVSYGEGLWKYTPPTDYRAMCTKNLATYG